MATEALGDERPALFLRKATGLVRGWNVRDSLIYAVLSTNFVTLGLFTFTYAGPSFPTGAWDGTKAGGLSPTGFPVLPRPVRSA